YAGVTNINQGVVTIQNSSALGSPAGGTTVNDGAALDLQDTGSSPVQGGPEALTTTGAGINFTGALRNRTGASKTWAGKRSFNNINAIDALALFPTAPYTTFTGGFIGVDAGKLTLSGVLTASDPIKMGAGTLEFSGVNNNAISGGLRLKQGTIL